MHRRLKLKGSAMDWGIGARTALAIVVSFVVGMGVGIMFFSAATVSLDEGDSVSRTEYAFLQEQLQKVESLNEELQKEDS